MTNTPLLAQCTICGAVRPVFGDMNTSDIYTHLEVMHEDAGANWRTFLAPGA